MMSVNPISLTLLEDYIKFKDVMNELKKIDSIHTEILSMQQVDDTLSWQEVGQNITSILYRLGERDIISKHYAVEMKKIFNETEIQTSNYIKNSHPTLNTLNQKKENILKSLSDHFYSIPEHEGFLISGVSVRLSKIKNDKVQLLINDIIKSGDNVMADKNNGYINIYTDNKSKSSDIEQVIMMCALKNNFKDNISELRVLKKKDVFECLVMKNDAKKILIGSRLNQIINIDNLTDIEELIKAKKPNLKNKFIL